jgi:DNA-binding SARP family transcriptional activator
MNTSAQPVRLIAFGGPRVLHAGHETSPGPLRQQLILARLIAARGRSVSLPHLIDFLWPESPPLSAANQIHRYIGQLRRIFEPWLTARAWGTILLPSVNGYRVDVSAAQIDVEEFYKGVSDAERLQANGQSVAAVDRFGEAVSIGVDTAFQNISDQTRARPELAGISADHILAAVTWADVSLAIGRTKGVADVLRRIATQHLLTEQLQSRLIRVLIADKRIGEALEHFELVRRALADQLGVDPGPELREAQHLALLTDEKTHRDYAREHGVFEPHGTTMGSGIEPQGAIALADNQGRRGPYIGTFHMPGSTGQPVAFAVELTIDWLRSLPGQPPRMQFQIELNGLDTHELPFAQCAMEVERDVIGLPHETMIAAPTAAYDVLAPRSRTM